MTNEKIKKFLVEWMIAIFAGVTTGTISYYITGSFIVTAIISLMAVTWVVSAKLIYDSI